MNTNRIFITQNDYDVLEAITETKPFGEVTAFLSDELLWAEIVTEKAMPPNVVTLYSTVTVIEESTSTEKEVTLVLPENMDRILEGKISVLSPVGAAIIGLREGETITWPMPSGNSRRFRVKKVLYQPEAHTKEKARTESFPARDPPRWL